HSHRVLILAGVAKSWNRCPQLPVPRSTRLRGVRGPGEKDDADACRTAPARGTWSDRGSVRIGRAAAASERGRGGARPPRPPGAANGRAITTLRENLKQVDLSEAQKDKVQDLVIELRGKIPGALKEAGGDSQARGKKIHDLTEEYRKKILDVLTPEQKA